MRRIPQFVTAALALALSATPAAAQSLLGNPGFETPATAPGSATEYAGGTTIGAWQVLGNGVFLLNTTYTEPGNGVTAFRANGGQNAVDLSGPFNQGPTSGVRQTVATTSGTSYLLTFFLGRAQSTTGSSAYAGTPTLNLSINGGGFVSFSNLNAGAGGFVDWQQFSYAFTAAGASTTVAFFNGATGTNYVGLDDVSLTVAPAAVVPEPATYALVAAGLAGVGAATRRRRVA